jgi:hypothetical protein
MGITGVIPYNPIYFDHLKKLTVVNAGKAWREQGNLA